MSDEKISAKEWRQAADYYRDSIFASSAVSWPHRHTIGDTVREAAVEACEQKAREAEEAERKEREGRTVYGVTRVEIECLLGKKQAWAWNDRVQRALYLDFLARHFPEEKP